MWSLIDDEGRRRRRSSALDTARLGAEKDTNPG